MFNQQTNDLEQNENTDESKKKPPETDAVDDEQTGGDEKQVSQPEPDSEIENPIATALFLEPSIPIADEFEEVIIDLEDLTVDDEYTAEEREEMEKKYGETMRVFRSGELVSGKIVNISTTDVAVDIGFKSEGSISHDEFDDVDKLKIGDSIEVCIDRIENREGSLVLSKRKAEFYRIWENINELYQSGEMLEAQISRRIKGGMIVDLFGIEAFLPGSQIDVHPVRDFDALVGVNMDFRIIKVNNVRKNVVLSHKVLVEESLREIRHKVLSELEEGQIVEGVVKNITDFGVFVDLGGVDGLLHITDLSWGRVSHPSDVVSLDEKIQIKVLSYDKEKQRISLGLKQLKEHHWDEIEKKYPLKNKVKGKVVSIVKYGAFIELEDGVEGLLHISEMSWTQHVKHPSQIVNVNDEIDVIVLNVDRENRKISLGIKQIDEDPWERLEQVFLSGTRHKGVVRDLVPFGAFVELEPGIDGLIHISDLSWTRKVRHPGEIVKKNQEIEIVILKFDKNERRIALGYKQLDEDPWDDFEKSYPIRSKNEGSVIRVLEKGVVVMLPAGVEGFVPNSQLGKSLGGENKRSIKEGDNIELQIIEFDKVNHRIVLSHSAIERGKERRAYRAYRESTQDSSKTIGSRASHVKQNDKKDKTQVDKTKKPGDKPKEKSLVDSKTDKDKIVYTTAKAPAKEAKKPADKPKETPVGEAMADKTPVVEAKKPAGKPKETLVVEAKAVKTADVEAKKLADEPKETPVVEAKAVKTADKATKKPADKPKETPVVEAKADRTSVVEAKKLADKPKETPVVEAKADKIPVVEAKKLADEPKETPVVEAKADKTAVDVKEADKEEAKSEVSAEKKAEKTKTLKPKTQKKLTKKEKSAPAKKADDAVEEKPKAVKKSASVKKASSKSKTTKATKPKKAKAEPVKKTKSAKKAETGDKAEKDDVKKESKTTSKKAAKDTKAAKTDADKPKVTK